MWYKQSSNGHEICVIKDIYYNVYYNIYCNINKKLVVSFQTHGKHLLPLRVNVVVSLQTHGIHFLPSRITVVVSLPTFRKQLLQLRVNVVVGVFGSCKQLPSMGSDTVQLPPPWSVDRFKTSNPSYKNYKYKNTNSSFFNNTEGIEFEK